MVVWALAKQTCGRLQNFVTFLGLYFMPLNQIGDMSLNDKRRRVATRDKTQTETQMDEPSVALDLDHHVSASGTPPVSFL
jgi:hypothetical protein